MKKIAPLLIAASLNFSCLEDPEVSWYRYHADIPGASCTVYKSNGPNCPMHNLCVDGPVSVVKMDPDIFAVYDNNRGKWISFRRNSFGYVPADVVQKTQECMSEALNNKPLYLPTPVFE